MTKFKPYIAQKTIRTFTILVIIIDFWMIYTTIWQAAALLTAIASVILFWLYSQVLTVDPKTGLRYTSVFKRIHIPADKLNSIYDDSFNGYFLFEGDGKKIYFRPDDPTGFRMAITQLRKSYRT